MEETPIFFSAWQYQKTTTELHSNKGVLSNQDILDHFYFRLFPVVLQPFSSYLMRFLITFIRFSCIICHLSELLFNLVGNESKLSIEIPELFSSLLPQDCS